MQTSGVTKKGRAKKRKILSVTNDCPACTIVGDPQHDIINLTKLLHGRAADKDDLQRDHCDLLWRLSGPEPPPDLEAHAAPVTQLSESAEALLKSACVDNRLQFEEALRQHADSKGELQEFLSLPRAQEATAWRQTMGSHPPRRTLQRVAQRLRATLHPTSEAFTWPSRKSFIKEARRIKRWYKKGKKKSRRNFNMPRTSNAPVFVRGLRTAWTKKVNLHYKRLTKQLRLDGLFGWQRMARIMRLCKLSKQTGTVSVERVWNYYETEFPKASRCISEAYFDVMSALLFLRFNVQHFKAGRLPGWLQGDSILATRVEAMLAFARAAMDRDESDLRDFTQAFQDNKQDK